MLSFFATSRVSGLASIVAVKLGSAKFPQRLSPPCKIPVWASSPSARHTLRLWTDLQKRLAKQSIMYFILKERLWTSRIVAYSRKPEIHVKYTGYTRW